MLVGDVVLVAVAADDGETVELAVGEGVMAAVPEKLLDTVSAAVPDADAPLDTDAVTAAVREAVIVPVPVLVLDAAVVADTDGEGAREKLTEAETLLDRVTDAATDGVGVGGRHAVRITEPGEPATPLAPPPTVRKFVYEIIGHVALTKLDPPPPVPGT